LRAFAHLGVQNKKPFVRSIANLLRTNQASRRLLKFKHLWLPQIGGKARNVLIPGK
jgi:hypothetical protein